MKRTPIADYVSRDAVALTDAYGTIYRLDQIDALSAKAFTNGAKVRFGREENGQPVWANDEVPIETGGYTSFDQGITSGFQYFQFANLNAGAAATINIRAFCKGGAA